MPARSSDRMQWFWPLAPLPLIYNCALICASLIYMSSGLLFFGFAHAFFLITTFAALVFFVGPLEDLLNPLRRWHGVLLASFLAYYAIMIILQDDADTATYHLRSLTVRVLPGLLMGYLAFASVRSIRFGAAIKHGLRRLTPSINNISVAIYVAVLIVAIIAMAGWLDSSLFIIVIPPERSMYQLFGNYMVVALVAACLPIQALSTRPFFASQWGGAIWMALLSSIAILSFVMSQMVGATMATAIMAMISVGLGVYALVLAWLDRHRIGVARFQVMVVVAVLATIVIVVFIVSATPLRIFSFKPILNERPLVTEYMAAGSDGGLSLDLNLAETSINSRIEILMSGMSQLQAAPIFGDLGVERKLAPEGGYIHSLISVQSHLGMIGSLLLACFILERLFALYNSPGYIVLKISTPPILLLALLASFFTWPLFWFLAGALYAVPQSGKAI